MKKLRVTKRFYLIVFCALTLYVGVAGFTQWREYTKIKAEQATIQAEIDQRKLEEQSLKYIIRYADSDAYVESVVRDKLGWVKKGETRYEFK